MVLPRRKDDPSPAGKDDEANTLQARLPTILAPTSAAAEAYRNLRTNLLYAVTDEPSKVIVVTSPSPRGGTTTICANLGVALAQVSKNTLIVDCNFREPALHEVFKLPNSRGVADVVVGKQSLQEVCQKPVPRLKVVCTGSVPSNSAEVLGSKRFAEFLHRIRQEFDYVLIDAPPTEPVADALILAHQSDGILLVVHPQKTGRESIRRSMQRLEAAGAKVLGTIVNDATFEG